MSTPINPIMADFYSWIKSLKGRDESRDIFNIKKVINDIIVSPKFILPDIPWDDFKIRNTVEVASRIELDKAPWIDGDTPQVPVIESFHQIPKWEMSTGTILPKGTNITDFVDLIRPPFPLMVVLARTINEKARTKLLEFIFVADLPSDKKEVLTELGRCSLTLVFGLSAHGYLGGRMDEKKQGTVSLIFGHAACELDIIEGMMTLTLFAAEDTRGHSVENVTEHTLEIFSINIIRTLELMIALNIDKEVAEKAEDPKKLNKKRMRKGKAPIKNFWFIDPLKGKSKSAPGEGHHASPRMHRRRGHLRRYPSGKVGWVRDCIVGKLKNGVLDNAYKVKGRKA